jgi:hypothetical protein
MLSPCNLPVKKHGRSENDYTEVWGNEKRQLIEVKEGAKKRRKGGKKETRAS